MISKEDLEVFGYYDTFPDNNPSSSFKGYSDWVEGKIITEGQTRLIENALGLLGEAGEVAEKIKKKFRDNNRIEPKEIVKELGDVLFYTVALANFYGYSLEEIIEINVDKLDSREERGVLQGSGDNR